MAIVNLAGAIAPRAIDTNGDSEPGALFYVYEAGTTTEVTTYSDLGATSPNAHPVVADAAGSFEGIYVEQQALKVDLQTAAGASLPGYPIDNIFLETADNNTITVSGTGIETTINTALVSAAATGGKVEVTADSTFSAQIVGRDGARLCIPKGIALTLDTDIGSNAAIKATDVPDFQICGGGKLVIGGNTTGYAVETEGQTKCPIDGLEITGHKFGVRIEANATSGIGDVLIRDLWVHDNYVHPTDPATLSGAGHALSISCRPSQGYDLTERVTLLNVRLAGVAAGATDGSNQYTKDLISIQGAKQVWVDGFHSKNSGEVGASFTFGCQNVTIGNALIETADGHGIIFSGAHYRLDISSVSGTFQVGETVTGGTTGATGVIEYLFADHMWVMSPSTSPNIDKIADGETITGGTSSATATVDTAWVAKNCACLPSVTTIGNGIDVAGSTDYAGVTAQHVVGAMLGGRHFGNKPWGMNSNASDFMTLENYAPIDATQTSRLQVAGSSRYLGEGIGAARKLDLEDGNGVGDSNKGWAMNADRQMVGVHSEDVALILNRTGASGTEDGDIIEMRTNGTITGTFGNDGIYLPGADATTPFGHSTLPAASGTNRKINFSTGSRGGKWALVRSDGTRHRDIFSGLPSRNTDWTRSAIEAESGSTLIKGAGAYTTDGAKDHPALSLWDGSAFKHIPLEPPAGTATISSGSTVAVTFGTEMSDANYAVNLTPHADVNVYVTSKATTGFTINRNGTGSLTVDWAVVSHANP